jgi:hypothetical protein
MSWAAFVEGVASGRDPGPVRSDAWPARVPIAKMHEVVVCETQYASRVATHATLRLPLQWRHDPP